MFPSSPYSSQLYAWQYLFTNVSYISLYFATTVDGNNKPLFSGNDYKLDMPVIPEVNTPGFWAVTAYSLPLGKIETTTNFTVGQGVVKPTVIYMSFTAPPSGDGLFLRLPASSLFQVAFRVYNPSSRILLEGDSPFFPLDITPLS